MLAAGPPAAAQPVLTLEQALAQDAAAIARVEGGDPAAALAELRAQAASVAVTEWIDGRYRDRLAGIALARGGDVEVLLTGSTPVADAAVTSGDSVIAIRFRTGARATRVELLDAIRRHQATIRAMLVRPPAIGIDPRRGELVVMIGLADAAGDRGALRRRIAQLTGVPVRLAAADQPDSELQGTAPPPVVPPTVPVAVPTPVADDVVGGSRVIGPDPASGRNFICTTGFVVADGARTGVATAAHCPDQLDHVAPGGQRTPLGFAGQWGWGYHDVQIGETPAATRPLFYGDAARTERRPVTDQRSRAGTRVGDIVCHRGERSGYSCARVQMTDFAPSGDLCGGACLATWVAVAGPGCRGGDSGGPVFIGTTALGLLKGSSFRGDRSCGFYYYMSLDYLPDGWRLLVRR